MLKIDFPQTSVVSAHGSLLCFRNLSQTFLCVTGILQVFSFVFDAFRFYCKACLLAGGFELVTCGLWHPSVALDVMVPIFFQDLWLFLWMSGSAWILEVTMCAPASCVRPHKRELSQCTLTVASVLKCLPQLIPWRCYPSYCWLILLASSAEFYS